ncbi:MAG: type II secretion system protein [Bacilli bacterium]
MNLKLKKAKRGFTIVELCVTISVIGIVAGVVTIGLIDFNKKSEDNAIVEEQRSLLSAYHKYFTINEDEIVESGALKGLYNFVFAPSGVEAYGFDKLDINYAFNPSSSTVYLFYTGTKVLVYELNLNNTNSTFIENSVLLYNESPEISIYETISDAYNSKINGNKEKLVLDNYSFKDKTALKVNEVKVKHTYGKKVTDTVYIPNYSSFLQDQYAPKKLYNYETKEFITTALYRNEINESNKVLLPANEVFSLKGNTNSLVENADINGYKISGDVVTIGSPYTYIYDDSGINNIIDGNIDGSLYTSFTLNHKDNRHDKKGSSMKFTVSTKLFDSITLAAKEVLEQEIRGGEAKRLEAYNANGGFNNFFYGKTLTYITAKKDPIIVKKTFHEFNITNRETHMINKRISSDLTLLNNFNYSIDFDESVYAGKAKTFTTDPAAIYNAHNATSSTNVKGGQLVIDENVTLTVPRDTTLLVNGLMLPNVNKADAIGKYAEIINNGTIQLDSWSTMCVLGKVSGRGFINTSPQSNLYERAEILDYLNNANSFGNTAGPNQGNAVDQAFDKTTALSNACAHAYYMNDNSALTHDYRTFAQPMFSKYNISAITCPIKLVSNANYSQRYLIDYGRLMSFDYNFFGDTGFFNIRNVGSLYKTTGTRNSVNYDAADSAEIYANKNLSYDVYFDEAGGLLRMSSLYMPVPLFNTNFTFNEGTKLIIDNTDSHLGEVVKLQLLPSSRMIFKPNSTFKLLGNVQATTFKSTDFDWFYNTAGNMNSELLNLSTFSGYKDAILEIDDSTYVSITGSLAGDVKANNTNHRYDSLAGGKYNYCLSYLKKWGTIWNVSKPTTPYGDFNVSSTLTTKFRLI